MILMLVLGGMIPGTAAGWHFGLHDGFGLTKDNAPSYHQFEAYLNYDLPCDWGRLKGIQGRAVLTSTLGYIVALDTLTRVWDGCFR